MFSGPCELGVLVYLFWIRVAENKTKDLVSKTQVNSYENIL